MVVRKTFYGNENKFMGNFGVVAGNRIAALGRRPFSGFSPKVGICTFPVPDRIGKLSKLFHH